MKLIDLRKARVFDLTGSVARAPDPKAMISDMTYGILEDSRGKFEP